MKTKTGQHQGDKQAQSGSTASSELESRIQKSREAIANYPYWVRQGMVFHGGGVRRTDPDEPIE